MKTINADYRLRRWELAALLTLCIVLLSGLWARREQYALASKLIRLHVVANSDSERDQSLKLEVRDAVLAQLNPRLGSVSSREEAEALVRAELPELERIAARLSGTNARASLRQEHFPTREYDNFSLPAGDYLSLRLELGNGVGKNWWCVVFPPMCLTAATATEENRVATLGTLSDDDISLISEEGGYRLKFRVLELWGELFGNETAPAEQSGEIVPDDSATVPDRADPDAPKR